MTNPKQSTQQAALLRVLSAIVQQRMKAQLRQMNAEQLDALWQSINFSEKEPQA